MTNPDTNAALTWLKGPWQAADNRRDAANAVAVIERLQSAHKDDLEHYAQELFRLQAALTYIREETIPQGMSPALFAEHVLTSSRRSPVEPTPSHPDPTGKTREPPSSRRS